MTAHFLQYLGAALALLVGFTGLLRPLKMESLLGLKAVTTVGLIEIRVLFGCFLIALPILAMILGQAEYFVFYGAAALAAGLIKTVFTVIDKCPWRDIAIGIATDYVLALLLMSSLYL